MARPISSILLAVWLACAPASAATILIATDEASGEKARAAKRFIETHPPFSKLANLKVVVRVVPPNFVKCQVGLAESESDKRRPESCATDTASKEDQERVIVCNANHELTPLMGETNADRTIFIKESATHGGTAGEIITMTTAAPPVTALHELMHTFGLSDEYEYLSACEADTYCPFYKSAPNTALFLDQPPYASDAAARSRHAKDIPWFGQIKASTHITRGRNLGTPKPHLTGLYPGKMCNKSTKPIKTWHPGDRVTVMETLATDYVPEAYWNLVAEGLHTKIEPRKRAASMRNVPDTNDPGTVDSAE